MDTRANYGVDGLTALCNGYAAMLTPPEPSLISIDAIAFQDASGVWIGQCIQYDIAAHARTLTDLPKAIEREVFANICINIKLGKDALDGIPPAPKRFADEFNQAQLGLSPNYKLKSLDSRKRVRLHDLRVVEAV